MSTTRNTDAVANQAPGGGSGEFKPRIERDEPMTTQGVSISMETNLHR
jgi:hypothetical protein